MLYRGVSISQDIDNHAEILPKGNLVKVTPIIDGTWRLDGKMVIGSSVSNTARAHHIKSGHWGGGGVSASRCEKVAAYFATNGFKEEGFIYVIDESSLDIHGVLKQEFADPVYPDEQEVTLIVSEGNKLPKELIVEKYGVNSEGKRT